MSTSALAIVAIIALLAGLVCYALVAQTLQHKREQRERLVNALTLKARNFKFMLNGFPKGFLPPELSLLIQKSLLEIYSQLADIDSGNNAHKADLQSLSQQMSESRKQATGRTSVRMTNPQQINEVKACLEELHRYIFQLEEKRRIPREAADAHRASIRELVVNITVDSYEIAGTQAQEADKTQLALHNLGLALKLMQRERKSGNFDSRIAELQQRCIALEGKLAETNPTVVSNPEQDANDAEWANLDKGESMWKKKQVYD